MMKRMKRAAALGLAFLLAFTALPADVMASQNAGTAVEPVTESITEGSGWQEAALGTGQGVGSETGPETGTGTEPESVSETDSEKNSDKQMESETDLEKGSETGSEKATETNSEKSSEADSEKSSETNSWTETNSETEIDSEKGSEKESESETERESESETEKQEEAELEFLYVTAPEMAGDEGQAVIAKVKTDGEVLERAAISYKNPDGSEGRAEAAEIIQNYAAFIFYGSGISQDAFTKLEVSWGGKERTVDLVKLQTAPDTVVASEDTPQVMSVSENYEEAAVAGMVAEDPSQIASALDEAGSQAAMAAGRSRSRAAASEVQPRDGGNIIIVLDPGHGGSDPGACRTIDGISYVESAVTMQMGWAVKAELETYDGVTVYLTRAEDRYLTLKERVDYAAALGATAMISLHINSTGDEQQSYATGALAFVSSGNYRPSQAQETAYLAEWILKELSEVGFKNNGLFKNYSETGDKYPNGSLADYYGIVRRCVLAGFPGMIIEHGFVNNPSDAQTWYNDAGIAQIAQADAAGIAAYYGLSKKGSSGGNSNSGGNNNGGNNEEPGYTGPTGWQQTAQGWVYLKKDGSRTVGWMDDPKDGRTYYMDSQGIRLNGWQKINDIWCFFNETDGHFMPEVKYIPEFEDGLTGWQLADDRWYYLDGDSQVTMGWQKVRGRWYYMAENGVMQTGWQQIDGEWYYLNGSGAMQTGWKLQDGSWYYFGGNGARKSGWQKSGGKWYYMDGNGVMQTGWQQADGKIYYLNGSGAMLTGWQKVDGFWYYLNGSGAMQTGWKKLGGKWYYMDADGIMQTGWQFVDGKWYYMSGSGAMQTGWKKLGGRWYYFNGSGAMQTGWKKLGGKWYYMDEDGIMQTGWQLVDGEWYYLNGSGAMQTGWKKLGGKWYYLNGSGAMRTGWLSYRGDWYYLGESGAMLNGGTYEIDGTYYTFGASGVML